jgi:hypothetical protein
MRRAVALFPLLLLAMPAWAQVPASVAIRDHKFVPPEIAVPARTKIELQVRNEQNTVAEFESTSLHREKIIPAGGQISVTVGPLEPGRYEFYDDFNQSTRGFLVVK